MGETRQSAAPQFRLVAVVANTPLALAVVAIYLRARFLERRTREHRSVFIFRPPANKGGEPTAATTSATLPPAASSVPKEKAGAHDDADKAGKKKFKKRTYHDLDKYIRSFSELQAEGDNLLIGFAQRTLPAINELIYGFLEWACDNLVRLAHYSNTKTVTVDKILILVRRLVFSQLDDEDERMRETLEDVLVKINSHVREYVDR